MYIGFTTLKISEYKPHNSSFVLFFSVSERAVHLEKSTDLNWFDTIS